jgi:hypothetical protein
MLHIFTGKIGLDPPTKSDVRKWRRRARKQELTNEEILQYENAARKRGHIVPESKIYNRRKRIKKRKNKPAN